MKLASLAIIRFACSLAKGVRWTMRIVLYPAFVLVLVSLGCVAAPNTPERKEVASVLKERLGDASQPDIGYIRNNAHLLVNLSTTAFPSLADSILAPRAREIATLALESYKLRKDLDSVTVVFREKAGTGMWWIRYERGFATTEAGLNTTHKESPGAPPNTR